jgi:hypothetical protein
VPHIIIKTIEMGFAIGTSLVVISLVIGVTAHRFRDGTRRAAEAVGDVLFLAGFLAMAVPIAATATIFAMGLGA